MEMRCLGGGRASSYGDVEGTPAQSEVPRLWERECLHSLSHRRVPKLRTHQARLAGKLAKVGTAATSVAKAQAHWKLLLGLPPSALLLRFCVGNPPGEKAGPLSRRAQHSGPKIREAAKEAEICANPRRRARCVGIAPCSRVPWAVQSGAVCGCGCGVAVAGRSRLAAVNHCFFIWFCFLGCGSGRGGWLVASL